MDFDTRRLRPVIVLALCALLSACATRAPRGAAEAPAIAWPRDARAVDGKTGETIASERLMAMMGNADLIVVGERHDDAVGHAVELALVDAFVREHPRGAVALEMLERHEQHIVNAYLAGKLCGAGFVEQTGSASWAPEGKWGEWYQPIVDRVRAAPRARLIAANAPRDYVSLARTDGYEALDKLPALEMPMVDRPLVDDVPEYRQRFFDTMNDHNSGGEEDGGMPPLSDEQIESYFRSQRVWDATMAASVANAARHGSAVMLIVGAFHADFEGGLVSELRARAPRRSLLTISIVPRNDAVLTDDDKGRADAIVFTPEEEDEENHSDESEA